MNLFKRRLDEVEADDENAIEGERVLGSVNRGISLQNRLTNWAVILGACLLAGVLLYKYYAGMYRHYQETKAPVKDVTRTLATTTLPPLSMPEPGPAEASVVASSADRLPPLQASANPPSIAGQAQTGMVAVHTSPTSRVELVHERRLKREVRFKLDAVDSTEPTGPGEAKKAPEDGATGFISRAVAVGPVQPSGHAAHVPTCCPIRRS